MPLMHVVCRSFSAAFAVILTNALSLSANAEDWEVMLGASRILPPRLTPFDKDQNVSPKSHEPENPVASNSEIPWIPLLERSFKPDEKETPLAADLIEAILRIEGMFDPTRIGFFGPALRMKIRAGTATMTNVFGDRWLRASLDPNIHFRIKYMAMGWLRHEPISCLNYRKFRPDDTLIMFDSMDPSDCNTIIWRKRTKYSIEYSPLTPTFPGLPIFASPFPGARFSHSEFVKIQRAAAISILSNRRRGWKLRYSASSAF